MTDRNKRKKKYEPAQEASPAAPDAGYVVHCASCGAIFNADYAYCPYCGRMNDPAAEREYMEHLDEIRQDVADLASIPLEETKQVAASQGKKVAMIVVATLVIVGILMGIVWVVLNFGSEDYDEKNAYLWRQENLPKLDACYDAEDYDGMMAIVDEGYQNGGDWYSWEHADFLQVYQNYLFAKDEMEIRDSLADPVTEMKDFDYEDLFYNQMSVIYLYEKGKFLDDEEKERLAGVYEEIRADFENFYKLPEDEMEKLMDQCRKDGFVSYTEMSRFAEKWRKQ